jgi:hypothetical protein
MWFIQVQQDEGTPSWRRFSELLNLRFGPPIRSNPLGELMEAQHVKAFTAGLQPLLSYDVEIHNPQSLVIAMSLARKRELREQCVAVTAPAPAV